MHELLSSICLLLSICKQALANGLWLWYLWATAITPWHHGKTQLRLIWSLAFVSIAVSFVINKQKPRGAGSCLNSKAAAGNVLIRFALTTLHNDLIRIIGRLSWLTPIRRNTRHLVWQADFSIQM